MDSSSVSDNEDDIQHTESNNSAPRLHQLPRYTTTGRVMSDVPPPTRHILTVAEAFDENGKPRPDVLKEHFLKEGRVEEEVLFRIVGLAELLFAREPNLLEVNSPCTGPLASYHRNYLHLEHMSANSYPHLS